jgi:hypothetical protein
MHSLILQHHYACWCLLHYVCGSADYEKSGKEVPSILPTLRGKHEKEGKTALPAWMMFKEVEKDDHSVKGYVQRVKNTMFGGLQADIFEASM